MASAYFMGIDTGTFASKGVLIDADASVVAQSAVGHGMENPRPNFYEHDAEAVWWHDFCQISNELISKSGIDPKEIGGVAASALGADCLPVDEECNPLRKAILYGIDARALDQCRELTEMYGETQIRAWFGRPLGSSDVMPKILWIKENEPDVHARAHKFLTGSSYITAKLTGEYYVDKFLGLASFNPLYGQDGRPDPRLCGPVCRPDQLAKVGETTDIAGCVTAKASGETGLAEGTPVTVGTDDSGAEGISCGIGRLGDLMLQLGSSVYMFLVTDHLVSDDRIWRERFIIPGTFDVSAGTNTAGTLTRWLRDTVFVDLKNAADARGENAYAAMAREAEDVPLGSEGLLCLPYFAGERTPINDPDARGAYFGLRLSHTRAHLCRAGLEGVAYSINQHFRIFEEDGLPIRRVMAAGGGTKNPLWMQIVADVTGKEIAVPSIGIGASYGDAMMAAVGTGAWSGFDELASKVRTGVTYKPDGDSYERYREYQAVFDRLYPATKELMHELRG
uniref:FGGY-family carbohydrate kinase n=1 Tax=Olsenella uli TaxID=133926 RepID=UPI0028E1BD05|nr:FGGY-family carbohydrate kinase [Olsenella uli]